PCVIDYGIYDHELEVNQIVRFYDNGDTLPSPLAKGVDYFVVGVPTPKTITISATYGGAAINTTGGSQSGIHKVWVDKWVGRAQIFGNIFCNFAGAYSAGLQGYAVQLETQIDRAVSFTRNIVYEWSWGKSGPVG